MAEYRSVTHRRSLKIAAVIAFTALLWSLVVAGPATPAADAQAVGVVEISEIFYNPDGQAEGHEFIELRNTATVEVDVSGWEIASGINFVFPPGSTIEGNGYAVIASNAVDFETVFGFAPTGQFEGSLANSGELLTVFDNVGFVVDTVIYDDAAPWPVSADGDGDSLASIDSSLAADDAARWIASTPTPRIENAPVLDVTFSATRGWYAGSLNVTLTPTVPGASIFYNTNGSGVATQLYTQPITVLDNGAVQVIQAMADVGGAGSPLVTHTYVFKIDQGVPVIATWPNGLATAPDEVEDTRSFEFLPPPSTGLVPVAGNAGVKASAGGIDAGESDKFFFRGTYGNSTLNGDLFGDNHYGIEPTTNHDQLFLRNNQGDATFLRQIIAHDALLETGQLSPHGRFVEYFTDGTDRGVRHMQERPEGGFMESYTGVDKSNWLVWSTNEVTPGSGTSNGLGAETMGAPFATYDDALSSIDMDSFIDYLLVQWQAKVSDYRNIKNFRTAGPEFLPGSGAQAADVPGNEIGNHRFHFFNWDLDLGYNNNRYSRGGPTGWGWAGYTSPDYLAHELDQFIDFRLLASDRIACAYFDDGALTAAAFTPRIDARRQELVQAGGNDESAFANSLTSWIDQRNTWLLDEFRSPGADTTVFGTFRPDRAPWKPPTNFTGPLLQQSDPVAVDIFDGVLTLTNPNGGTVYYRTDGGDPRTRDGALSPQAIEYTGPVNLIPGRYSVIARSFNDTNPDAFQAWTPACNVATDFDVLQSGGFEGSAGLGLAITEIQYNPVPTVAGVAPAAAEFLELTNTTAQPINASGFMFADGVDFIFPLNTVIAPGQSVTLVPEGSTASHLAEYAATNPVTPLGEFTGRLNDGGETLRLVDAVGALVDEVSYDDIAPWPTGPDGQGPSLSLISLALDNDLASSWAPSRSTGTPGGANDTGPRGDADCDGVLTIGDALVIAQFSVGTRQAVGVCPLTSSVTDMFEPTSDIDLSGSVDLGDALLVAQCSVGVNNGFCLLD